MGNTLNWIKKLFKPKCEICGSIMRTAKYYSIYDICVCKKCSGETNED